MELVGRSRETAAIDVLLARARRGEGGSLVLGGPPGIGLTSVLGHAAEAAGGVRVLELAGLDEEAGIPHAALHRLLASELGRRSGLPRPQCAALEHCFGLQPRSPGLEREGVVRAHELFAALGALELLASAGRGGAVLCVVDDADRLDAASQVAIALIARRLGGRPLAMLLACHDGGGSSAPFAGLDRLTVGKLRPRDARSLLEGVAGAGLDPAQRERVLRETDGNPLAIAALAGGDPSGAASGLGEPLRLGGELASRFGAGFQRLSAPARDLVVLAAVAYDRAASLFWPAADLLGIAAEAGDEAEAAGLIRLAPTVAFTSPLLRAAVFSQSAPRERRRAHAALAEAAGAAGDPAGAAWHRAAATSRPDERIAAELAAEGIAAAARGEPADAALLLERAAALTPAPVLRGGRLLAAAQARLDEGSPARAAALLVEAAPLRLRPLERARAESARATAAYRMGGDGAGIGSLLRAAKELAARDEGLGREALLEVVGAAIFASPSGADPALADAARAALAIAADDCDAPVDALLHGLALLVVSRRAEAAPMIRRGLDAIERERDVRGIEVAGVAALELWDDGALRTLASVSADVGAGVPPVPAALVSRYLAGLDAVVAGRFRRATDEYRLMRALAEAGGHAPGVLLADAASAVVRAWLGERDVGHEHALGHYALAVLHNGQSLYEEALAAAEDAAASGAVYPATFALPELVEAAVRIDAPEKAAAAAAELSERAMSSRTEWALGTVAQVQALLASGEEAERLYAEAVARLSRSLAAPHLARAHLLYGEWLRRHRRRREAREHLRRAHDMFVGMGSAPFAARAQGELDATGEHLGPRRPTPPVELTPQELRIVDLVVGGASNADVGGQLFISARTVEYHLRKIYRKLGVASRFELAQWARAARHEGSPVAGRG